MYTNKKTVILKICLAMFFIYVCVLIVNSNTASQLTRHLQKSGINFQGLKMADGETKKESNPSPDINEIERNNLDRNNVNNEEPGVQNSNIEQVPLVPDDENRATYPVKEAKAIEQENDPRMLSVQEKQDGILEKVKSVTNCLDRPIVPKTQQRGDYWVLYNYVRAERTFKCHESITYTTHADYSFMDNLLPLVERWRGPVSIALHAPGTDFKNTLDSIAFLRDCVDPLVRELVTFHVYFSTKHVPKQVPKHNNVLTGTYNCSALPPFLNVTNDQMYKTQKNLLYPVNVGRNIARETAQTHFILPSDIELYPSANVIMKFLGMIAENKGPLLSKNPKVFPLTIFEVGANQQVPETKTILLEMLHNGSAIPFHKKVCPECHTVPKAKEWQVHKETEGLHVFHVGKRNGRFLHWEPIFIGTHGDPLYDERLSWEGKSDKMTQGYALCVMDYNFLILDNAFLVHKPGIKVYKKDAKRDMLAAKTRRLIKKIIFPELKILYGTKKGCVV